MSVSGGAAANGKSKPRRKQELPFKFLNYKLTPDQTSDLIAMVSADEFDAGDVFALIEEGYTFKVAPDGKGGGYRAFLIDHAYGEGVTIFCLSGRGSDARRAVTSLMYKHLVLAGGDWSFFMSQLSEDSDYG